MNNDKQNVDMLGTDPFLEWEKLDHQPAIRGEFR
jgi:hypothetical protein